MMKFIYRFVYNRKNKLNREQAALLQIEVYYRGKRKYFSTNLYLRPNQWDEKRKRIKRHPNALELNKRIQEYLAHIEQIELNLWRREKRVSLEMLKKALNNHYGQEQFVPFFLSEVLKADVKESTRCNHLTTWKKLQEYNKNLLFEELDYHFLLDFEEFLYRSGCKTNTVGKHMRHLKRYVNVAINKGYGNWLDSEMFMKYRIKSKDIQHQFLMPEELKKLEDLCLPPKSVKARQILDAFLFCTYTGLRYSDFCNLNRDSFTSREDGLWLILRTIKTDAEVHLPLHLLFNGKAIAILERYFTDLEQFFHLPDNSNVNKQLVRLTQMVGIKKKVTFHVARHTNATLLVYYGVNITTVQKLLGHKNVRTTEVYAEILDKTIVRDLQNSGMKQ